VFFKTTDRRGAFADRPEFASAASEEGVSEVFRAAAQSPDQIFVASSAKGAKAGGCC
jgi:hypothetical protein